MFYSLNLIKFNIFIFKNYLFLFFKEYISNQLKNYIYNSKFNSNFFKKSVQFKSDINENWLHLFLYKESHLKSYSGRKEMYSLFHYFTISDLSTFFKLNTFDWYYFIFKILKLKSNKFVTNKLSSNYLYKKKFKFILFRQLRMLKFERRKIKVRKKFAYL